MHHLFYDAKINCSDSLSMGTCDSYSQLRGGESQGPGFCPRVHPLWPAPQDQPGSPQSSSTGAAAAVQPGAPAGPTCEWLPGSNPSASRPGENGVTWQSSSFPFLQLPLSEQYSNFQHQPNCLQQWPRRHSVEYLI